MRLLSLWDQQLRAMDQAPAGFGSPASAEILRKIDRLVAFVDGVVEGEEDVKRHPLVDDIRNWAPWNFERLAEISDSLTLATERAQGFSRLRRSLGQPDHYIDAVTELSLATEFLRADIGVSFVMETKDKRTSDLLVEFDGEKIYVEITRLGQSTRAKEAFSFFNREDWRVAEFGGLDVEIRLVKFLSRPRLRELVDALLAVAEEVRASGKPNSYTADGLLSASIRKATAEGTSSFGVNFPSDVDQVDRLARTIRRKTEQLPHGQPGVLIIVDDALHVSPWERPNFSRVVAEVEEYVYEHSRLAGLLIILPFSAAEAEPFTSSGESWVAWRRVGTLSLFEDRILIGNRYAESPVPERVLAAVGCPMNLLGGRRAAKSPRP